MRKVALITGAAERIGRAIAVKLAKQGYDIAVHYYGDAENAKQTVEDVRKLGRNAMAFQSDLSNYQSVVLMEKEISNSLGHVTCIVNNAGYAQMKSFFDYEPLEWQKELDICLNGTLHLAYVFIPAMKEQRYGKFITLVGDSARTGDRKLIMSATARGGVMTFIKSLAQEVGRYHIECNVISLGLIDQNDLHVPEEVSKKIVKGYPLNRLGSADDVAHAVSFLSDENTKWITGQIFSVNGGYTMLGS